MSHPPLRELQLGLRALIAAFPASPAEAERVVAGLSIAGDARLPAAERARVYASMYFLRLRDALAADFTALRRALGDDPFEELVRRYLVAHPSDRPSLRDLGRHLASFAATDPELAKEPWLAELAALEWAMVEAFDAADAPALQAERLRSLEPEAWPALVLEPVPSLVLLDCATAVDVLRERILAGEAIGTPAAEPIHLRVWRQDLTVFHRRIEATEAAALRRLRGGITFAELCADLATPGDEPEAATGALRLLDRWLEDGVLIAR